ncbi:MAG: hypothetical protein JOY92_06590 [Verrucomicrobia bacterium]|nr:hypothetical protein [Verrucomicrobiota bacterium]
MSKSITFSRHPVYDCARPFALLFLAGLVCHSASAQSSPPTGAAKPAPSATATTNAAAPGAVNAPASPAAIRPASANSPQGDADTQKRFAAMSEDLKQRIAYASNKVMIPLVQAESKLYNRFTYFEKPERLDPTTFGSKGEVAAWKDSLKELRGNEELVEKLYANVSDDFENALIAQRISGQLATSIKKQVVNTIPWDVVQKKEKLVSEFIENHGKLLNFYETNWGTWKASGRAGVPAFENAKLADTYQQLRDKITVSGQQIVQLYAKLRE